MTMGNNKGTEGFLAFVDVFTMIIFPSETINQWGKVLLTKITWKTYYPFEISAPISSLVIAMPLKFHEPSTV